MTIEIEDAALARFLDGPAPYASGNPPADQRPRFRTAEQELADALEGQAPTLAREIAEAVGPIKTVQLARAVGRAVAVGINRRADQELADRLHGLYVVLEDGLRMVEPECTAPESSCPCAVLNDDGDCIVCGEHWESALRDSQMCGMCGDMVWTLSSRGLCDGCEAEANV